MFGLIIDVFISIICTNAHDFEVKVTKFNRMVDFLKIFFIWMEEEKRHWLISSGQRNGFDNLLWCEM